LVKLHNSVEKIIKTIKWHNKNTKYNSTVQIMNEDPNDVYCTVQHNEFTEVQRDHRDPLVCHQDQRQKQVIRESGGGGEVAAGPLGDSE
jgi:hypothetical protein